MNQADHNHQRGQRRTRRKSVDVATVVIDVITGLPMGEKPTTVGRVLTFSI